MHAGSVRAVVFDLGNTLWFQAKSPDLDRVYRLQAEALTPLLGAWGITLGEPLAAVLSEIWRACSEAEGCERARGSLREPSLPAVVRGALAVRGIDISVAQAEAWHRAAWISEVEFGCHLYPGAIDVLSELREMGIAIGVNSTRPCTGDMLLPGLRDLGLAPYVDAVVCSGDTGYVKPHPSTFRLVLDRLGVIAGETAMVGDLLDADVRGAKGVGMCTVWKLNGREGLPPCADVDYVIHDLFELLSLPIIPRGPHARVPTDNRKP